MKIIFYFILTNLVASCINAQWIQQTSGTSTVLTELYFINKNVGFVVGQKIILKTIDGGETWNKSFTGDFQLEGIYFTDSLNGFAIGYDLTNNASSIIQTTDSGNNWTVTNLLSSSFLYDIYFITQKIGFVVGSGGKAFKTIDGGNNWEVVNTGTKLSLEGVFFTDTLNGIIVGGLPGNALILKTEDGGKNWVTIIAPKMEFLRGVYFPSKNIGYAVGWNGTILKTTDGGNSWISQTSVDAYGNLDLYFINDSVGYIVGGSINYSGIQKTIDGGNNWTSQIAPVNQGLVAVFFNTNEVGYCVGANGTILKTNNGGISSLSNTLNKKVNINLYPNPSHDRIIINLINADYQDCFISFYNLLGELSYIEPLKSTKQLIKINNLQAGVYIVNIRGNNVNVNSTLLKE